jgi:threonine synthase
LGLEHVTRLVCVKCHASYGTDVPYTCPVCGIEGILDVEYDYEEVARTLDCSSLERREPWMWRYKELLPVDAMAELPHLQVGWTPVYGAPRLAAHVGIQGLWIKDDGRNPTASFKDRASAVAVMKAKEKGAPVIACASTGNAASSLAGFAAATALTSFIFVPASAPEPKVAQLLVFGANVLQVKDTYDGAYALCMEACSRYGWYNRNCAINPYCIEGKKTAGLEIGEQLADRMPDWVVLSVGDGCTLAGVHKGLKEMFRLNIGSKVPKMLGVQAKGAAPVAAAFRSGSLKEVKPKTLADSISVGVPRNWRKAVNAVRESGGEFVTVTDAEILEAMRVTARLSAVFAEPAASAAVAGLKTAVKRKIVGAQETALVVITGNGLKDIKSAIRATKPPISVKNDMDVLAKELRRRKLA